MKENVNDDPTCSLSHLHEFVLHVIFHLKLSYTLSFFQKDTHSF